MVCYLFRETLLYHTFSISVLVLCDEFYVSTFHQALLTFSCVFSYVWTYLYHIHHYFLVQALSPFAILMTKYLHLQQVQFLDVLFLYCCDLADYVHFELSLHYLLFHSKSFVLWFYPQHPFLTMYELHVFSWHKTPFVASNIHLFHFVLTFWTANHVYGICFHCHVYAYHVLYHVLFYHGGFQPSLYVPLFCYYLFQKSVFSL